MQTEEIKANLTELFGNPGEGVEEEISTTVEEKEGQPSERKPVDIYQERKDASYERSKKPLQHGADKATVMAAKAVAETLAPKYRQYKGGFKHMHEIGEDGMADQLRQQYLVEDFLPAVEAVVARTSPDSLLNSQEALAILNEYSGALVPKGYVEGYLKQAYADQMGQNYAISDGMTTHMLRKITALCEEGNVRVAVGMAKDLLKKLDQGEQLASEADYNLIVRIANA